MRKVPIYIFSGLYLFIVFGHIFHTSTNPTILGKYSSQYSFFLLLSIGLFLFYRKAVIFVFSDTIINRQNGKILTISPIHKTLFYFVIFLVCPC